MSDKTTPSEREAFEAWFWLEKECKGDCWEAWQARAALSPTPKASAIPGEGGELREALQALVDLRGHGSWGGKWIEAWDNAYSALASPAIVGTPSKEGAAQVEAVPEGCTPTDARVLREANHWFAAENHRLREALEFYAEGNHFVQHDPNAWDTVSGEPANLYEDEANTATVEDGSIAKLALATPPASPSEGGGEQIAHIKQAIYTISGGDFDATDDEARRIAEAVRGFSPSRGEAVDAAPVALVDQRNGTRAHWIDGSACANLPHGMPLYAGSALAEVKQAIRDYHYALDTRQHGGVAQDKAFSAIQTALQMHWVQGEEQKRRTNKEGV